MSKLTSINPEKYQNYLNFDRMINYTNREFIPPIELEKISIRKRYHITILISLIELADI